MISGNKLKAFVPTKNPENARIFYRDILGLKLISEDNFAMEFDSNGTKIRITNVQELKPQPFTILGWDVDNIVSAIKLLNEKNIYCEKYDSLKQDELGIWISPEGTKVAWFKDPDGNILSFSE
jgi:catechol 2,3-dioxygenase-like lactoylglutathione lyase family enzyme